MCRIISVRKLCKKLPSDYSHDIIPAGGLEIESIKKLGRLARMEDRLSPYYNMCADAILSLGLLAFGAIE